MSGSEPVFPRAVFVLWEIALWVTFLFFIPLSVYLLHSTYRAARSIDRYLREALQAAGGIAGHTAHIPALDTTITTATEILSAAGAVEGKLGTVAGVLARREG